MPDAQTILELMQSRRQQNLAYFEQYHPKIYEAFHNYTLRNAKLNISPDGQDINLLVNGKALYEKDYRLTGKRECDIFLASFPRHKPITTVKAPGVSYFPSPRSFHSLGRELIENSPVENPAAVPMISRDNYPLVVVTGVGLGGHIESLSNRAQVSHFIIYEPNPDVFAASLYTMDWAGLFEARSKHSSLSVQIFVGNIITEEGRFSAIWNTLARLNPLFPTSTYYFNHLGDKENIELIDRLNKDIPLFFSVWGFYDDELNQLNQCLHNIRGHSALLNNAPFGHPETPIFIVGAGPSLDTRIEDIRQYQDKAIVISCGTALKSLHHYGITPDFHLELESHQLVVEALKAIDDPQWMKGITIISPSHIHPEVIQQFGDSLIYFKRESALWGMFGKDNAVIPFGTPTCTNAAVAFCYYYGFRNVYLFGCDYGFKDLQVHHSQGSIYYQGSFKEIYNKSKPKYHRLKDINGDQIYSTDIYFTSLRTVEKVAYAYTQQQLQIKNCSEGVDLKYTQVTSADQFKEEMAKIDGSHKLSVIENMQHSANTLTEKQITNGIKELKKSIKALFNKLDNEVLSKSRDFEDTVFNINHILEKVYQPKEPAFYWFVRGSIWHLSQTFYTHELCLTDEEQQMKFQLKYRQIMKKFSQQIESDLDMMLTKSFTADDPWLKVPLNVLPAETESV